MWLLQRPSMQVLGPVLSPDLPGFGTELPALAADRSAEAYADWVAAVLASRGDGPYRLAGYSFGGSVALLLAARHPALVSRLALCCTSPRWGRGLGCVAAAPFVGPLGLASAELFQTSIRLAYGRASRLLGLGPEQAAAVRDMLRRAHRATMADLCRSLARSDFRGVLPSVRCPTLVVGGTREFLVPIAHHRQLAAGIEGARLRLLPGASHVLCLTRAPEFSAILTTFFST